MSLPALSGYEIKQAFASGGMANIYDAIQVSLNRPVAIKFLNKQLLTHSEAQTLFEHESLIIASLNHPNIVQIIDKGITEDSQPYFVMEKIVGMDLSMLLEGGQFPLNKKLDLAIQICKGLDYAHKNGIIHRDIKPSNIIIDQHGDAKILDFGIALLAEDSDDPSTQTTVLGTTGYVAPEQLNDYGNATVASDIYSVGVLFFDLFGTPDFTGEKIDADRLDKDVPEPLKQLILKCCHQDPRQRYQSLADVKDDLLQVSRGSHLGQSSLQAVENENSDLASNFVLLDVLSQTKNKRVFLFQKKSNKQLLVIRRNIGEQSGLKEAKILTSLKHPNITNILAAVKQQENTTIVSEYLSGGSLSNQLIQCIPEDEFLDMAIGLSDAIDFAHQNNIIHGNLNPGNILFDEMQTPKIHNFGQPPELNSHLQESREYVPQGESPQSRQYDIYCLGAIFHHMLYGVVPGDTMPETLPKISFRLQRLIDKMLTINPHDRPESAQAVVVELRRIDNRGMKKLKSRIGENNEKDPTRMAVQKRSRQKALGGNNGRDHTTWLAIALIVSVVIIVGLLLKDHL